MKYVIVRDIATGKYHLSFSDLPPEPHLQEVDAEYDLGKARRRVDLLNHPELAPLTSKLADRIVGAGLPLEYRSPDWNGAWEAVWWEEPQPPKEKNP
jgi:hypothetical protein